MEVWQSALLVALSTSLWAIPDVNGEAHLFGKVGETEDQELLTAWAPLHG